MDVTTATQSSASNPTSTTKSAAGTAINADFETFLKMLTAQLQNQDPLNPLDSQDFAVQLATFSGVEQAVRTNDLLEGLRSQMASSDLATMGNLIGQDVRVVAQASFKGNPIEIVPTYLPEGDTAELVVRDDLGREVDRISLNKVTDTAVEWTGIKENGASYPWGSYSFHVIMSSDEQVISDSQAQIYAPVLEARLNGGTTQLVLPGGVVVEQTAVTGVRGKTN